MGSKLNRIRILRVAALLAGALTVGSSQGALAGAPTVAENYGGAARAEVLDLSLLGRRATFGSASAESTLETVDARLAATASGLGTSLSRASQTVARFNDATAPGGKQCATPALGPVLRQAAPRGSPLLPEVEVGAACSEAAVTGGPQAFVAQSSGGRTTVAVSVSQALQDHVQKVAAALDPTVRQKRVGELVKAPADVPARQAVGTLNGLLGTIAPGVQLPDLQADQKVDELLTRIQSTDLVRMTLGSALARNTADAASYRSEGASEGGTIDVLPDLQGPGQGPLLKISVAPSQAGVDIDRATGKAAGSVRNAVVRIEGTLLERLPISGLPVVGGLVNGVPLSAVPGGQLPVVGGVLGGGLPRDQLLRGLGVKSSPASIELGPGQGLSVLCEGPVAPFCSEISVGAAKSPVALPNGRVRAEASTVSIHLFKGLDNLVPGAGLATALGTPALAPVLGPLSSAAGLDLGEATGVPGVKATLAGAVTEAGGVRVLGEEITKAPEPALAAPDPLPTPTPGDLPRTGGGSPGIGLPFLVAGTGLCAARRRWRH